MNVNAGIDDLTHFYRDKSQMYQMDSIYLQKNIFISIPIELRSNDLNLMKHALKWSVHMCRHNQKDPNQKD